MKNKYALEIVFLVLVIALSLVGFSSPYFGKPVERNAYHYMHIITSLA